MRTWLLLIVILAASTAHAANQPATDKPIKNETTQENTGTNPNKIPMSIGDSKDHQETAKTYKPDCSKPSNEGEANFCNLSRQAAAAEVLNDITASQIWWSKLGFFALLVTIVLTAVASISAAWSAKLAREAIGTGRAWITLAGVTYFESTNTTMGTVTYDTAVTFFMNWKNTGNTPGIKTQMYSIFRFIPIDERCPEDFKAEWAPGESVNVIGPDMPADGPPHGIGAQDLNDFIARKKKVVLFSAVRYFDIFEPRQIRESEACFELTFNGRSVDNRTGNSKINVAIKGSGRRNMAS